MQNEQRLELANKIKELGFYTWREYQRGTLYPDAWETENIIIWCEPELLYFSKTFTELSKWFLEEHKLHCVIDINADHNWTFTIYNVKSTKVTEIPIDEVFFKSKGEAELHSIQEMVNQVELRIKLNEKA